MKNQLGVGLIEILVALLLLAIGALGFVALQYRANEAGNEASHRVLATEIARDLAEKISINHTSDAIEAYKKEITVSPPCDHKFCTSQEKAQFDLNQTKDYATSLAMTINIMNCPIDKEKLCIYVAWDKTKANDKEDHSCTVSDNNSFHYNSDSTCVVMEAF